MSKRKSISKKIRFEVFKRDKFICQYCGEKAPDVILEVDHIDPKAKGASNEIINLLTSCKNCNRGKRDVPLDDQSALGKQRKQIEELQERREQIELMLKWRESLEDLDSDILNQIVDHINNKIDDFSLNETGKRSIEKLLNKFELSDILEAIDISAKKYLKYDAAGSLIKESVDDYINKIGGILVLKGRSPIEQKIAYIKGICRNKFNYFDNRKGSILLNEYVEALRNHGWSDKQILNDLENEVEQKTKELRNWTGWRSLIEGWTNSIKEWEKTEEDSDADFNYTLEQLNEIGKSIFNNQQNITPSLSFIGKAFDSYDELLFKKALHDTILDYLNMVKNYHETKIADSSIDKPRYWQAFHNHNLTSFFSPVDSHLRFHLDNAATYIITEFFDNLDLPPIKEGSEKDMDIIIRAYTATSDEEQRSFS